jgi:hypothetical protein
MHASTKSKCTKCRTAVEQRTEERRKTWPKSCGFDVGFVGTCWGGGIPRGNVARQPGGSEYQQLLHNFYYRFILSKRGLHLELE